MATPTPFLFFRISANPGPRSDGTVWLAQAPQSARIRLVPRARAFCDVTGVMLDFGPGWCASSPHTHASAQHSEQRIAQGTVPSSLVILKEIPLPSFAMLQRIPPPSLSIRKGIPLPSFAMLQGVSPPSLSNMKRDCPPSFEMLQGYSSSPPS